MRVPRIYSAQPLNAGDEVSIEGSTAHYLSNVLRMDAGRECILFNGQGFHYFAVIVRVSKKTVVAKINKQGENNAQSPLAIELMIGISKGDRMEWVLQKATELGVHSIQPFFATRSQVKLKGDRLAKKKQHWQQIIVSACEQNTRDILPFLHAPTQFDDAVLNNQADKKFVLHHRTSSKLSALAAPCSVCILIGPEGGLSDEEISLAEKHGFLSLALGPRVLRTETAPLAAISIMQHLWGDM